MDVDPITNLQSTGLLELKQSDSSRLEFLPAIWEACTALISPTLESRFSGLKRLEEYDAGRHHVLVSHLLVTRINEPDIELRSRVIKALASVFTSEGEEYTSTEKVRRHLANCLAGLRTRQIFAMLQVTDFDPSSEPAVAGLLSYCSFAGGHLADILGNRRTPLSIRKHAAHFIGRIGFLDALPCLEKLEARLESRSNGRSSFYDTNSDRDEEQSLLPFLKDALSLLRAP